MRQVSDRAAGRVSSVSGRRRFRIGVLVVLVAAVATACQAGILTASIGTGSAGNTGDGQLGTVAQMVTPESIAPIPGGGY